MSFLTRIGSEKMAMTLEWQVLAIKLHTKEDVSLKVMSVRGEEGEDSSEVININRCVNRVAKTFRFQTQPFARKATFFVNPQGKVDKKKATVKLVKS